MIRSRGFSLLEVLAALALLSIVLLGVYSGIHTAARIVRSGDRAIERMDEVRSAQNYLRSELAQALAIPFDETDDGDPIVFKGTADTLSFVAPMPGYLGPMGPQLHILTLVAEDHDAYRLETRLFLLPPDGGKPTPLGEPQVLLRDVRRGSFAYRGLDDQNKPTDWLDTWPDDQRTPSLIRISMQTEGGTVFPTLLAPMRIDPSASRNAFSPARMRGTTLR